MLRAGRARSATFDHQGDEFYDPRPVQRAPSPQRYPVQIQAGDSDGGRELAARYADVIFSRHSASEDGQAFYADVKGRLARYGRSPTTSRSSRPRSPCSATARPTRTSGPHEIRLQQVRPQGAIAFLEQVWGRDLSGLRPGRPAARRGPRRRRRDLDHPRPGAPRSRIRSRWRSEVAGAGRGEAPRIRQLIIEVTARTAFIGTPGQVAEQIDDHVQADAADGYIFVPHLTPHGLDEFVDKVVPELQDRGVFRSRLRDTTRCEATSAWRRCAPNRFRLSAESASHRGAQRRGAFHQPRVDDRDRDRRACCSRT